jgi:hypothetical protein
MKIFLVGEEPTDCGRKIYNNKENRYYWEEEPAQIFVRKYAPDAEIITVSSGNTTNIG